MNEDEPKKSLEQRQVEALESIAQYLGYLANLVYDRDEGTFIKVKEI